VSSLYLGRKKKTALGDSKGEGRGLWKYHRMDRDILVLCAWPEMNQGDYVIEKKVNKRRPRNWEGPRRLIAFRGTFVAALSRRGGKKKKAVPGGEASRGLRDKRKRKTHIWGSPSKQEMVWRYTARRGTAGLLGAKTI